MKCSVSKISALLTRYGVFGLRALEPKVFNVVVFTTRWGEVEIKTNPVAGG